MCKQNTHPWCGYPDKDADGNDIENYGAQVTCFGCTEKATSGKELNKQRM